MQRNKAIVLLALVLLLYILLNSMETEKGRGRYYRAKYRTIINSSFLDFDQCFEKERGKLTGDMEKMWVSIDKVISACDSPWTMFIRVTDYQNQDEIKRHIIPLKRTEEKDVIITLGIGKDIHAEEKLMQALGADNTEFYGADPITTINKELYSKIGKYFPFAVGARSENGTASVLERATYTNKVVVHVNIIDFLKKHVQRTFIDNLLLDAEYAEYDMLDFFHRGGQFDYEGITFCLINAEIHSPSTEQKIKLKEFILRIQEEKKYAMLKTVNVGHLRLFMVNMDDERCVQKYVSNT